MKDNLLALAGGIVGGAIGFFLFGWLLNNHGLYGLVLPGGLLGIGASFAKNHSIGVPIICCIAALALGAAAEFHYHPFKDPSVGFFFAHFFDQGIYTLVMIALGGAIGFWCPFRQLKRTAK